MSYYERDLACRRGGEHHENVLVEMARIPALLAGVG
jgi:hypothetical protein